MTDILLVTLNARYTHASLALRYLLANLNDLAPRAAIHEFTIHDQPLVVVERLLAESPRIIGLSVSIWNRLESERVVRLLRLVAPEVRIVLGGPEVSHEWEDDAFIAMADVLVTGEGDGVFADICRELQADIEVGKARQPLRVVKGVPPNLATLALPYDLYSEHDLTKRIVYVEASRGCPFECSFCLSSLDERVRSFPAEDFLAALERLIARGCRTFKFLDRTFNLGESAACRIVQFFLDHWQDGMFVHFEMVPDRLPLRLRELLAKFPPGGVQLEIGIQSFTPAVLAAIHRRMDATVAETNLTWLRQHTAVHLHVDLIAGLPEETPGTFAASFDRLWPLRPHEIQVGILKRLKGTPIIADTARYGMRFNHDPPYDLVISEAFGFADMQRIRHLARAVEVYANRGRFSGALDLLCAKDSPYAAWLAFAEWLITADRSDHGISQDRQYAFMHRYLTGELNHPAAQVRDTLRADFLSHNTERYLPQILR